MQRLAAAVVLLVGVALLVGTARANSDRAALALGGFLFVLGIGALLVTGRQSVHVDPAGGVIVVADRNVFGERTRRIQLDDVEDIRIQRTGGRGGPQFYSLELRLRTGGRATLFAPGRFYRGTNRRETLAEWSGLLWSAAGRTPALDSA